MMGNLFKVFGIIFLIFGITAALNSFQGITGFAVYEGVDVDSGFYIGTWFFLTGILLTIYKNKG